MQLRRGWEAVGVDTRMETANRPHPLFPALGDQRRTQCPELKIAGTEKGGGGALLLHHVIEIRGKGSGVVHGGEAAGRIDQLDKLVTVPPSPLVSKWTSESGAKGEGLTQLV